MLAQMLTTTHAEDSPVSLMGSEMDYDAWIKGKDCGAHQKTRSATLFACAVMNLHSYTACLALLISVWML